MIYFLFFLLIVLSFIYVLPIKDSRSRQRDFPWMTVTFVVINILIHGGLILQRLLNPDLSEAELAQLSYPYLLIPQHILDAEGLGALSGLSSMFLHGDVSHLLGNIFFLWFFGRKVEDVTGHFRFGVFYLLAGFLAALAHVVAQVIFFPAQASQPALGASGAISGVLGAYLFLYTDEKISTFVGISLFGQCLIPIPYFIQLPAWVFLVFQFVQDAILGQIALEAAELGLEFYSGIGVFAHMGGLVGGLIFIYLFLHPEVVVQRY